jgi:hypothetical protein
MPMRASHGQPRSARERRSSVRVDYLSPSSVIFDENVQVFCSTVNVSERGACLKLPGGYRMPIGERFTLKARCLGPRMRAAIVVRQVGAMMSCAFH